MDTPEQHFEQHGYVVVRNAIDDDLVASLLFAVERIIDRALGGDSSTEIRWIDEERRMPDMMNDLLSPGKYGPAFGLLFDTVTLPFVESLLGVPVRCSWLSLFPSGAGHPYSTPLHRDNNPGGSEEIQLLERHRMRQCYFQAPLTPEDRFLQVVPGSHLRAASEAEIAASAPGWDGEQLPGLTTVTLEPGDVVYRHTDMLHRGWNPKGTLRWTLISSLWAAAMPILDIEKQDHETLSEPGFIGTLSPRLQSSVQRYLEAFERLA